MQCGDTEAPDQRSYLMFDALILTFWCFYLFIFILISLFFPIVLYIYTWRAAPFLFCMLKNNCCIIVHSRQFKTFCKGQSCFSLQVQTDLNQQSLPMSDGNDDGTFKKQNKYRDDWSSTWSLFVVAPYVDELKPMFLFMEKWIGYSF